MPPRHHALFNTAPAAALLITVALLIVAIALAVGTNAQQQPSQPLPRQQQPQLGSNATVCVAQIMVLAGARAGNLLRIDNAARRCAALGADIAVFPETALLGWDNPAAWNRSASLPGPDSAALGAIAARHHLTMVVGLAEHRNTTTLHDSAVLLDGGSGAVLGVHRKINVLSDLMDPPYTPGDADAANVWAVETPCCGRVGVLICADTFREDVVALMAAQRPDLVLVPYGWSGCEAGDPDAQECTAAQQQWPAHGEDLVRLVQGVANATGAVAAGADAVGQQIVGPWRGQTYGGWSVIAAPLPQQAAAEAATRGASPPLPSTMTTSGVLVVAADRDVDVQVATVAIRSRSVQRL